MANLNSFVPPNITSIVDVVRDFGAVGDAVINSDGTVTGTDNTAAFVAAFAAATPNPAFSYNFGHWLYVPPGRYMVSDRLETKSGGSYGCCVRIIGAHIDQSEIVLKNAATGYGSAGTPKPLIFTSSQGTAQSNTGFRNALYNLTLTIGAANPGAIACDMNVSNTGGMRHVRIRSVDPGRIGLTGLALTRAWPGPAYFHDVTIEGFNYGVDVGTQQYSVTFEHLKVLNQLVAGVRNTLNVVPIRDLVSSQSAGVPAVLNGTDGFITVIEGDLSATAGTTAIDNAVGGFLHLRNIRTSGYINKLSNKNIGGSVVDLYTPTVLGDLDEFVNGSVTTLFPGQKLTSLRLPVMEAPEYLDSNPGDWANVMDYGAVHGGSVDQTPAIQAAMNSGRSTVYFPGSAGGQISENCTFTIKSGITIPPTVKRIIAMQTVCISSTWPNGTTNMFTILDGTDEPLFIDGITCGSSASGEFASVTVSDAVVSSGSNTVTSVAAAFTSGYVGRAVADRTNDATTAIPAGTLITAVPDANTLTLSANATASGTRILITGNNIDITGGLKGGHFIEHASRRPLVMSECSFTGGNLGAVFRTGCGFVHMVGCLLSFVQESGTRVWARGHNMELTPNRRIENQGGDLWMHGLKIEKYGTIVKTTAGGRTEIEGGFNLPTGGDWTRQPAFECIDASHSLSFSGYAFQQYHAYFDPQVRETKAGVTNNLTHASTQRRSTGGWTDAVPLHVGRLV